MEINNIFRFIETLKTPGQGRGMSAKEFEDYFNQASMSLWRREADRFEQNLSSTNYLSNFKYRGSVVGFDQEIDSEVGRITSIEFVLYEEGSNEDVALIATPDLLDDQYYSRRKNDKFYPPTQDYPIANISGNQVLCFPEEFDGYLISGLKYPRQITYATTVSEDGRDYVFDEVNSIDTDWDKVAHGELIALICKSLGITLKDDWLTQYFNIQKQTEIV